MTKATLDPVATAVQACTTPPQVTPRRMERNGEDGAYQLY